MYTTQEYQEQHDRLVAASFTEEQARAIMQHVETQHTKKLDSLATKAQVADVELALSRSITDVRSELKQESNKVSNAIERLSIKMEKYALYFFVLMILGIIANNTSAILTYFGLK